VIVVDLKSKQSVRENRVTLSSVCDYSFFKTEFVYHCAAQLA